MEILIHGYKLEYQVYRGNFFAKLGRQLRGLNHQIVFVHGFAVPYQNYDELFSDFSQQGYDVYTLNLPGHGTSEFHLQLSLGLLTDLVTDFVGAMDIDSTLLVGYSMGGTIALKLCEQKKDWIKTCVAIAPLTYGLDEEPGKVELGLGLTQLQVAEQVVKKEITQQKVQYANIPLIAGTYRNTFSKVELDLQDNSIPIRVVSLTEDKVIDNQRLEASVKGFHNTELVHLPEFNHTIYHLGPELTRLLSKIVLK